MPTLSVFYNGKFLRIKRNEVLDSLINQIRENVNSSIDDLGYEIYHIEYVNEFGHKYLRIMISHKDDLDKKITVKDCETVSKTVNVLIDDMNIEDKFFLEVSSPGVNRRLYTDKHMSHAIGKKVCVKLHKSIDGNKKFIGTLISVEGNKIIIKSEEKELEFDLNMIKNINLEEIS